MGIFEYECPKGHVTEHFVSLAERPDNIPCAHCGSNDAEITWAKRITSAVKTTFRQMDRSAFKRRNR